MLTLGIETTGRCGGIALWKDDGLVAKLAVTSRETHSRRLVPSIRWLLKRAGLSMTELDCVSVSLGPGSFTGIRIGLSTARGISLSLGIDLSGVPTLDVLAHQLPPMPGTVLCPMIDARNFRFYTAIYRPDQAASCWKRISDYRISTATELAQDLQNLLEGDSEVSGQDIQSHEKPTSVLLTGDGLSACRDGIESSFSNIPHHLAPEWMRLPCPSVVAALAERYLLQPDRQSGISPLYVKLSQAEENRLQGK